MLAQSPSPADPSKLAHTVLAETMAAPSAGAPPTTLVRSVAAVSVREAPPVTPSSHRTTVLPRIEVNGAQAELVFDGKQRFEKIRVLGEGGLGEVVGAHDHDIGRKVAIKRLKADVRSPAALARFVDEIRTIGKLEHPNIIPIHDVGMDEQGELYFVMKYVDGETLESVIEKLSSGDPAYHKHYTFERRVEIFRALLEALAFAHDKGIVHRDIKPANVMIGKFGEVLLMDWGIAKSLREDAVELPPVDLPPQSATRETSAAPSRAAPRNPSRAFETMLGSLIGTPLYMAPEQAAGQVMDERADVYSVCLVLYELLYLRHPYANKLSLDDLLAAARAEPIDTQDRVHAHQPPVPVELMWFLRRGLEKDRTKRYQSIRAMIDVLDRRADGDICVDCPVTLAKSATMKSTKILDAHPVLFMAASTAFAVFFIALIVLAIRGLIT